VSPGTRSLRVVGAHPLGTRFKGLVSNRQSLFHYHEDNRTLSRQRCEIYLQRVHALKQEHRTKAAPAYFVRDSATADIDAHLIQFFGQLFRADATLGHGETKKRLGFLFIFGIDRYFLPRLGLRRTWQFGLRFCGGCHADLKNNRIW
jgi:hypothetical protein